MTSTAAPVFVPGVWGPYFSAMVPGMWLNEGGQSAAGAAIDHLIECHPAGPAAADEAGARGIVVTELLIERLLSSVPNSSDAVHRVEGLHVVPEFLGNRAPYADPHARAVIAGLGMERDLDSLAALYLAGICGIGYGLRQIIETQARAGAPIEKVVVSGGASQSPFIRQILADATGISVLATKAEEPVLLGAATLGAVAGQAFANIGTAMAALSHAGGTCRPAQGDIATLHDKRYDAFQRLQALAREIR
jgi:D-ribulokinase